MAAKVEVLETDITTVEVDAIANAANTRLAHGGGVAGAISRAGGPEIQAESDERAPIGLGEAVETTAGDLPCRWVIHAATMELGGPTSADIIRRATASTLQRAEELGARSSGRADEPALARAHHDVALPGDVAHDDDPARDLGEGAVAAVGHGPRGA